MTESTTTRIYTALDRDSRSIRLLNILPDLSSDGLVQCTMHHTTIEVSNNEYSCLSYVWGLPTENLHAITLNGDVVHIRPNLFNFLSDARTRFTGKKLWIDALCIDQSNILERNHQVQQMGDIYSHATEVLVWLVEPDPKLSQLVFEGAPRELEGEKLSGLLAEKNLSEFMARIIWLADQNEYWRRAWIVQEFVLAKRIYILFGPLTLSPADFKRMAVYLESLDSLMMLPIIKAREKYIKRDPTSPPFPFSRFFMDSRAYRRECINPRDRVFSLRAICEDGPKIPVDYSIPLLELIVSILKLEEGKLCFCYIHVLSRSIDYSDRLGSAWRKTLRFQISSTKQPLKNSSEIDADEVHELDLGPVTKSWGGTLSWRNGVVTYSPVHGSSERYDVSCIRLVKDGQGGSLWRFTYRDMIIFSGGRHPVTEPCLRDPAIITIGKWDP